MCTAQKAEVGMVAIPEYLEQGTRGERAMQNAWEACVEIYPRPLLKSELFSQRVKISREQSREQCVHVITE